MSCCLVHFKRESLFANLILNSLNIFHASVASMLLISYTFILQAFVGTMLATQPQFILGIDDVGAAKSNAFGAMGMFIGTFALSIIGLATRGNSDEKERDSVTDGGYQLGNVNTPYEQRYLD